MNINGLKKYFLLILALNAGWAQAAYVQVNDATGNSSRSKAYSVNSKFSYGFDKNITNPWDYSSSRYTHASAVATTNSANGRDWYSFSTYSDNVKVFLDIDGTKENFRSWLGLYNSAGSLVAFNDTGEVFDPGSKYPWDSFLFLTLAKQGQYFVAVGRDNNKPLMAGQNYILNIGKAPDNLPLSGQAPMRPSEVPLPAGLWLFGSALAVLIYSQSRKQPLTILPA